MDPNRKQVELLEGAVTVSYDPAKWGKPETDQEGIVSLDRSVGPGTAALIAESIGIPTGRAIAGLLEDFGEKHGDLEVLCRETRTVHGCKVGCLKLRFGVNGQPVVLYLYCYGGLVGTVQVRTCAGTASFDGCERDFTELLDGLEIHQPKHPRLKRLTQSLGFAAKVTIGAASVIGIALFRFGLRMHWWTALLLTGILTVGVFLAGWIYDLVKYPLE